MIRYGFACKTVGLPGAAQSSLTLARASRDNLLAVSRNNLCALEAMLRYCRSESLALMRISSDIIPLASHEAIDFDWQAALRPELEKLAALARQFGKRGESGRGAAMLVEQGAKGARTDILRADQPQPIEPLGV